MTNKRQTNKKNINVVGHYSKKINGLTVYFLRVLDHFGYYVKIDGITYNGRIVKDNVEEAFALLEEQAKKLITEDN